MFLNTLTVCAIAVLLLQSLLFFIALYRKNNSIADIGWGMGFILIAYVALVLKGVSGPRQILITMLTIFWGARLAIYIYLRSRGKPEDFRYKEWRRKWGKAWQLKSYMYVFLLQGAFMLLVSLPVSFTNTYAGPQLGLLDRTGLLLWIVGFYFEGVGDWQMMQFKRRTKNSGKILMKGLWKYTRHPNYFGEVCMWWGIYLIALSNPHAWWTFVGPLFITFSLLHVSGLPLLERRYKGHSEYQEYKKRTSAFVPWFPKHID